MENADWNRNQERIIAFLEKLHDKNLVVAKAIKGGQSLQGVESRTVINDDHGKPIMTLHQEIQIHI